MCAEPKVLPEEEHVVRVESVYDPALLLQSQHTDVKPPGAQEVQDQLDHLRLLEVDGLFYRHGCRCVAAAQS